MDQMDISPRIYCRDFDKIRNWCSYEFNFDSSLCNAIPILHAVAFELTKVQKCVVIRI